jgi:hypothetical protein
LSHFLESTDAFTRVAALSGCLMWLLAAVLFLVLFKHTKARGRRLSSEEAGAVALYPATTQLQELQTIRSKGVGYAVNLSCNIDSLRNAAKRGDWLTFWLWPALICTWCIGGWLILMAFTGLFSGSRRAFGILGAVALSPIVLIALFMPWAAIYTRIDLGADSSDEPSKPISPDPER